MSQYRVGLIVPSSNTTMETEIPAILRAREEIRPERFTFHSSRMRMKHVDPAELAAMDADSLRCAVELSDARVDVMAYACLVAIMAQGLGYHRDSQKKLAAAAEAESGEAVPVVSSAGALVQALHHLGARRIAVLAPYMRPLTATVCEYIEHEGVQVTDSISLEVADNLAVGRLDPSQLVGLAKQVDTRGADALVLSACVQMPSLAVLDTVQQQFDIPVVSAASATVWRLLTDLGLDPVAPRAGALLAPR
ncbi:maleate isomerase [Pseudonocardia petroleophila]|uniref:Maleate isomerase n=1 Tax=Pseudonocardia petroleophila TaxID=37331 RepID=A0A7G7MKI9_9PSEU|nr:aspartate/glutamate racemase family protein [Pseudonocardia petroleophila]QNG53300.1 aspartate/glutamate racemase family protein [Pseudonocardia petroleophila]